MVRRITWVRTSMAGLRAARVPALCPGAGLKANAAKPPAVIAMTTAAIREYCLRIKNASESWDGRDCVGWRVMARPSQGKHSAKRTIFLAPASDPFTRGQPTWLV